jgi:hypothetical protein
MLHRLICFLVFTKNLVPDYKNLFAPYITPTDKIIDNVYGQYLNEYFHNIIANKHEKVVLVTSVVYDSCNRYAGKTINGTSEFFKNTLDDVEVYISKMISTRDDYTIPYTAPPFDIVEFYQGPNIPYEEKIMQYYDFDKCIVYNYNQDKCQINVT